MNEGAPRWAMKVKGDSLVYYSYCIGGSLPSSSAGSWLHMHIIKSCTVSTVQAIALALTYGITSIIPGSNVSPSNLNTRRRCQQKDFSTAKKNGDHLCVTFVHLETLLQYMFLVHGFKGSCIESPTTFEVCSTASL